MSLFRSVTEMVEPFQIRTSGASTGNVLVVNSDGYAVWSEAIPIATDAVAITQGTITAQAAGLSQSVTWNNVAVQFIAQQLNVTNTASDPTSLLVQYNVGGSPVFEIGRGGGMGIGGARQANTRVLVSGSATAATNLAVGLYNTSTLIASANNDVLIGLRTETTRTPGAFTGLSAVGLFVANFSVASFTSPAPPSGITIGVVTGTGASAAYGILLNPPTGATANYLISHTTPGTFNVLADGTITGAAYKVGATAGVTAGPFTTVSSIQTIGGIVTTLTGT